MVLVTKTGVPQFANPLKSSRRRRDGRGWPAVRDPRAQGYYGYGDGEMKTTARKWRNSLAIRVPKRLAEEGGLREKDTVDIEVREGASLKCVPDRRGVVLMAP